MAHVGGQATFGLAGPVLYLDMDGVLMDFNRHKDKHIPPWENREYHHLPRGEWTTEEVAWDAELHKVMALPEFWTTMEPMPDAHVLWGWCAASFPHVLTATPASITYRDRCARDKLAAIHNWFDPTFPADRFNAVLRSEKAQFAPGNVLVDDMQANCQEWAAAGGTAILHKDAISTIRILREFFHD